MARSDRPSPVKRPPLEELQEVPIAMHSPLWQALLKNEFDNFKRLFAELTHDARLELVQENNPRDGQSLLHIACTKDSEIVDLLLRTIGELPDDQRVKRLWHRDEEGRTPLYYACLHQRADIVRQLLRPPWPSSTNPDQCISITATDNLLATNPTLEIMRDLLRHSRGNPLHQFNEFMRHFPSCHLPTTSLESAVPIIVVGDNRAGKSTIIKSLQIEGAIPRLIHLFRNVRGAARHRAGIVPTQVPRHDYLGRVVFYELSGNREFVNEAILECGYLADAIFLIVINTKEEIDIMTKQIVYWIDFIRYCSNYQVTERQIPNIIVVGTHRDVLPVGRFLAPNERFLLAFRKAREVVRNCRLITHLTSDFRKARAETWFVQWKLYSELQRLRQYRPPLPSICYILYSIIQDLCEQKKEKAITIHELFQELSTSNPPHYQLLPQNTEELIQYCDRLCELNVLLILKDDDDQYVQNSWIISDPLPLLNDIEEALFTDVDESLPAFQDPMEPETSPNIQASSLRTQQNSGVLERSELEERFQNLLDPVTTDTDLLIKVMKHFKYTDVIVLQQAPPRSARPCFYIPHLLPQTLVYENWLLPDDDYTYICTWAMTPNDNLYSHFMPHIVHRMFLRLSLSSIVPHHCSRSHRSLAWADPSNGVQVFISDYNSKALSLNVRCYKGKEIDCLKLRTTIIDKIRSLMAELIPDLSICELLIPRSRVQRHNIRLPILNPLERRLRHCKLEKVIESVTNGREHVIASDLMTMPTLSDLLYFDPYSRVQKIPKELRAHLGDPNKRNDQITDQFLFELLKALGAGDGVNKVLPLLFKIIEVEVPLPSPLPDNLIDTAALASRILQGTGLTYSELRDRLDSICIVKHSDLQW